MAAIASAEVLNMLAGDFRFLFNQRQVDTDVQICFADLGLTTISLFALLGDDVANVRVAQAAPPFNLDPVAHGLDPATMLKRRIAEAKVLDAWQAAKCRVDEKNKAEAKQRTSGVPISLTQGEHVSLRQSFGKAFGRMDNEMFPSSGVIERRLQEVEQGNPTAEPLSDVASSADVSADAENIVLEVPLPNDSEELRRRVRLLGHTFTIAKLQNPNRPWLATASSEVWLEHLDYILGPRVWGLNLGGEGRRCSPPWQVVLSYELALRREALRLVTFEGKNLRDAMFEACRCTELREVHFITPALVSNVQSLAVPGKGSSDGGRAALRDAPWWPPEGYGKNENKGNGKGNGKGGGKNKFDPNLSTTTPDGKQICFAYNNQHERCSHGKACRREHVCRRCFEPHPLHMCDKNFRAPEATGV